MAKKMKARFSTLCPKCGEGIEAGKDITRRDGQWVHLSCPSSIVKQDAPSEFKPSQYQEAVFDFVKSGEGNAVVEAVAGSGKTTTIVHALQYTSGKVLFVAFNKHIADELSRRAPDHVRVCTLHSLGLSNLRSQGVKVDLDKSETILDRYIPLDKTATNATKAEQVRIRAQRMALRQVSDLAKATLTPSDIPSLGGMVSRYGLDINGGGDEVLGLVEKVMSDSLEMDCVDFADMIWMAIRRDIPLEQYDWVFVDEAQDLNAAQIELVLRSVTDEGRVIAVGDRYQSLYGFRGADTEAIPRLIRELNAVQLPLSITYRCPKSHVARAAEIVPDISAWDEAEEGIIVEMGEEKLYSTVQDEDMILCRVNAPLIGTAMRLIRRGIKATVRGRDIGRGLIFLAEKMPALDMEMFIACLNEYHVKERVRLLRNEARNKGRLISLDDKVETLHAIASEVDKVEDIPAAIGGLFSDDIAGVVLSSIHRAKGLEAERVFVLHPELLPHPRAEMDWEKQQERNCEYVAMTRSKRELYIVREQ